MTEHHLVNQTCAMTSLETATVTPHHPGQPIPVSQVNKLFLMTSNTSSDAA